MLFLFFFLLSRAKSPSFTPSPPHSPTPHLWLPLKTSSQMVTSYPVPMYHLRSEVSEKETRAWAYPEITAQPDRRVSTSWLLHLLWLPTPHFPRQHLLLLWMPGILPPTVLVDQTLRARGNRRQGSWYWHRDRWCWLWPSLDSPKPRSPLSALLERNQKCIHNHVSLTGIRVERWSGLLCGSSIY